MEKIKVFLRLGKRPHPGYYVLIDSPPENVDYKYDKILRSSREKAGFLHWIKVKLWLFSLKSRPPIIKINPRDCDVIHSTNNIMNSGKTPWVMDVEHLIGLFSFNPSNLKKKKYFSKVKKTLSLKYCKKLMPYTLASKLSMVYGGLGELESKMEVIYPAKESIPNFKKTYNKIPKILWIGRRFWEKGGNVVLQVFNEIDKKVNFNLIMKGPVPEEIKKKYKGKENIKFLGERHYSNSAWKKLFKEADILLYPTNLDSLGNAFFDAMNYKVPVVTGDVFSTSEIIENGKNGFVVNHPMKWHNEKFQSIEKFQGEYLGKIKKFHDKTYIRKLAEKVMILIKNPSLREKMGKAGYQEISKGKFSIKRKNEKLEKIYKAAGKVNEK